MKQRDDMIQQLSDNLKATTENRDQLQNEYSTQAEQLAQQVQTLQLQLQQVISNNSHLVLLNIFLNRNGRISDRILKLDLKKNSKL